MLNPARGARINSRTLPFLRFASSVRLLMHRLKRRSCYHKYWNHMPLCHVYLFICSPIHYTSYGHHLCCIIDKVSVWFIQMSSYLDQYRESEDFQITFFHFCHSFSLLGPAHSLSSKCWLIPTGASSEFTPFSVIYREQKRQEGRCNQDNSGYFQSSHRIVLNGSIQLCLFPYCDTAAWL